MDFMNDENQAMTVAAPQPVVPANQLTPAQARVEAVAKTLELAYSRASTLSLTPDETAALKAEFPDEAFKMGAGGNPELIYIEHAFLRDRFNAVLGMGQWAIIRTKPHWGEDFKTAKGQSATRIYADCALLIRGCLAAEAIGTMVYYPSNSTQDYSDAAKGSVTAAFRRCASDFGVGLQAWKKDFCEGWKQRNRGVGQRPAAREYPIKPADPLKATDKTRAWMLGKLSQFAPEGLLRFYEHEYHDKIPGLEAWSLDHVPTNKSALAELVRTIEDWQALNAEDAGETPVFTIVDNDFSEPFWKEDITVPRAGMKRADYLKAPDTIRSLYDAMKAGDEKSKTRLWGLAREWTPSSYIGRDGQERPPLDADLKCRESLDQFVEWSEKRQ